MVKVGYKRVANDFHSQMGRRSLTLDGFLHGAISSYKDVMHNLEKKAFDGIGLACKNASALGLGFC